MLSRLELCNSQQYMSHNSNNNNDNTNTKLLFIFIYIATLKPKFTMCLDIKTEKTEAKQSILRKTKKLKINE